jgi:hypothetical protein
MGVRASSILQEYLDAGRDRADLGALGAARAAVFETMRGEG